MMVEALDFRFGWRWLLPLEEGYSVGLYGFDPEEEQFWQEALSAFNTVVQEGGADALLLNADSCSPSASPTARDLAAAFTVCVLARRSHAARWQAVLRGAFSFVREYGLLPEGNPRVVVPLSSTRHVLTALCLHRPGRQVARLGVGAARVLARVGNDSLLRGRVLLIATRGAAAVPMGAVHAELSARLSEPDLDYALYLGTPDDNRKTVVLPLGRSVPDTILKVAATPKARAALKNEATALAALGSSDLAGCVPEVSGVVEAGETLTLHQEYRPRQRTSNGKIRAAAVAFLGRLSALERQRQPLAALLESALSDLGEACSSTAVVACQALLPRLQILAQSGTEVWMHRTHGDFAPWNCSWTDRGLFVFDWEESRAQDLAFGDAFYYAIAPALHVQGKLDAPKTLEAALCLAQQVATESGMGKVDVRLYLALWLMARLNQASLYGELLVLLERDWR